MNVELHLNIKNVTLKIWTMSMFIERRMGDFGQLSSSVEMYRLESAIDLLKFFHNYN